MSFSKRAGRGCSRSGHRNERRLELGDVALERGASARAASRAGASRSMVIRRLLLCAALPSRPACTADGSFRRAPERPGAGRCRGRAGPPCRHSRRRIRPKRPSPSATQGEVTTRSRKITVVADQDQRAGIVRDQLLEQVERLEVEGRSSARRARAEFEGWASAARQATSRPRSAAESRTLRGVRGSARARTGSPSCSSPRAWPGRRP